MASETHAMNILERLVLKPKVLDIESKIYMVIIELTSVVSCSQLDQLFQHEEEPKQYVNATQMGSSPL